ncbi:MAG: choice-of-anchor J domain-containing protein [Bacteroidia bacterium]|nr:choice-of-anchor J domain-containing protein [Bacteroidia bacterium]
MIRSSAAALLLLALAPVLQAQGPSRSGFPAPYEPRDLLRRFPCGGITVLDERFDASDTLPAGWTAVDADGLMPREEIRFLTPAGGWQVGPDPKDLGSGNQALLSPSWYEDTVGQSNDWLISPRIDNLPANVCLSWYAYSQDRFYLESYEVYISTSNQIADIQNLAAALRIPSESADLNYRTLDLSAYAGQSVYVVFRHTSKDRFMLVLDDIRLARVERRDLAMFRINPVTASPNDNIRLTAAILNQGLDTIRVDSAVMTLNYRINGGATESTKIKRKIVLLPNDTLAYRHDSIWKPVANEVYRVEMWFGGLAPDANPANDTLGVWQGIGTKTPVDPALLASLRVYPNPAASRLVLETDHPDYRGPAVLRILDLHGREALPARHPAVLSGRHEWELDALPPGLYLLQIRMDRGPAASVRFVKE